MHFEPVIIEEPDNIEQNRTIIIKYLLYLFVIIMALILICIFMVFICALLHYYLNYGTEYVAYFKLIVPHIEFDIPQVPKGNFITSLIQILLFIISAVEFAFFCFVIVSIGLTFMILTICVIFHCVDIATKIYLS